MLDVSGNDAFNKQEVAGAGQTKDHLQLPNLFWDALQFVCFTHNRLQQIPLANNHSVNAQAFRQGTCRLGKPKIDKHKQIWKWKTDSKSGNVRMECDYT